MSFPIALILGAGSGVGRSVALKLKQAGYKVATASRNPDVEEAKANGFLPITVNVQDTGLVADAFKTVHETYGVLPNVVVFNGVPQDFRLVSIWS
jgi:NAD(P)-dependent dehydrogenase (short-subunit alcohol dehydrogenase family)